MAVSLLVWGVATSGCCSCCRRDGELSRLLGDSAGSDPLQRIALDTVLGALGAGGGSG